MTYSCVGNGSYLAENVQCCDHWLVQSIPHVSNSSEDRSIDSVRNNHTPHMTLPTPKNKDFGPLVDRMTLRKAANTWVPFQAF